MLFCGSEKIEILFQDFAWWFSTLPILCWLKKIESQPEIRGLEWQIAVTSLFIDMAGDIPFHDIPVMYGCESWTIRKAECRSIDAFELWSWRRLLSPLDCKEINLFNPKKINPEYSLEGLMLNLSLPYSGHLMQRSESLEKTLMLGKIEGRKRREQWRMKWLDSITYSIHMNLSKLQKIVKDREVWCAAVHGVTKSWTRLTNWTTTTTIIY